MRIKKTNHKLPYFIALSILIHALVLLITFNDGNSDVANEFIKGEPGIILNVTLEPKQKNIVTQDELNQPIWDFMQEENFEMLVEEFDDLEKCDIPFHEEEDDDNI